MSCVAAVVEDGRIYIAADSFLGWSSRSLPMDRSTPKVFRHASGMLVGTVGSASADRKLRAFALPTMEGSASLEHYALEVLGPAMSTHVHESFEFVFGIDGRLYHAFPGGTTIPVVEGFTAIGSGGAYAMGSLAATAGCAPRARVRNAVAIAERYVPTVRGPYVNVSGKARTRIPGRATPTGAERIHAWRGADGVIDLGKRRRSAA